MYLCMKEKSMLMVTDFIFFEYTSKNVSSKCGQGFFDSTKGLLKML